MSGKRIARAKVMADGRAAGLVNLAYIDEPEDDLERTAVGGPDAWTDDDDIGDVTAVHISLDSLASEAASEADAEDPTHVEREAPVKPHANDTSPPVPVPQKSDVRALTTRLGPPTPPQAMQPLQPPPQRSSTLIPAASTASRVQSVPPEPMLFTPSAMPPPPRAMPATAATYPTIVPPAFAAVEKTVAPNKVAGVMGSTITGSPAPPPGITPQNGTPAALASTMVASPAPPAVAPPPIESSVLPLSREITEPPPAPAFPRPAKTPTKVEGLLFMPPPAEGSVVMPMAPPRPSEGVISTGPKTEPVPPPQRPPSPSFDDLRALVEVRETDLARRPTEPMPAHPARSGPLDSPLIPKAPPRPSMLDACAPIPSWEIADAPPLPPQLVPQPTPSPRASALGLEVHFAPPEKALESILPPAPPEMIHSEPMGVPVVAPLGQMAIETVKPPAPHGGAFFMTMIFFVGYVFRAGFGRVVDASAQMGELGREVFEAIKAEWYRAQRRASTKR